jgi:anthranilate phosphoribosyltransferase
VIRDVLEKILNKESLDIRKSQQVFEDILDGKLSEAQIAAYLTALRAKGEDFNDLAAGAAVMRAKASPLSIGDKLRPLVDNCGTGGDGSGSFNISTTSAIIAASMGVRIAKHGNRSISSKCGSADLLFKAGYPEHISIENTARLLEQTGFTFFFAPNFHPTMKHVGPVRKALGIRTIFNLLGPLANPIAPEIQLIGVGAKEYLKPVAQAAEKIGIGKALIVHSRDGMDEISPNVVTDCVLVKNKTVSEFTIDPANVGLTENHDLSGGDADENLKILNDLLAGNGSSYINAVALNAGALLWLSEKASNVGDGFNLARNQITTGKAQHFFDSWLATAKSFAGASK